MSPAQRLEKQRTTDGEVTQKVSMELMKPDLAIYGRHSAQFENEKDI